MLSDESAQMSSSAFAALTLTPMTIASVHFTISMNNYLHNLNNLALMLRDSFLLGTDVGVAVLCAYRFYHIAKSNAPQSQGGIDIPSMLRLALAAYAGMLVLFFYGIDSAY